jgi:4-alpha-glucanotransferase
MMKKDKLMHTITDKRASGILMHVSSLPGEYGIGDLGSTSRNFVDFLASAGQSYWQILPLVPVSPIFGNSPYMSCSAFAGNPLFISPELLLQDGRIQPSDLPPYSFSEYVVEFDKVMAWKSKILAVAWRTLQANGSRHNLDGFINANPWVKAYGLFMALKDKYNQKAWFQWPGEFSRRDPDAIKDTENQLKQEILYFQFEQYLFFNQWQKLRNYANKKGIRIIGDLPIYVAFDSVDVWANQNIFELDPITGCPTSVAGVPPDYFSNTGQLWGNPLYRWNTKKNDVKNQLDDWWAKRLEMIYSTVDVIRIDHFRGFESYWSVPAKEKTAVNGRWEKGPGIEFFQEMEQRLGTLPVIAEDLGLITPAVITMRDDCGFPGMKILLFGFDGNTDNEYLPQNYSKNCIVYTGTHDNDTAVGWYLNPEVSSDAKKLAKHYANHADNEASSFHQEMIYLAHSSTACLSVLPMQDVLGFGNDCRMNTPGTTKNNWQWRCAQRFISDDQAEQLHKSTRIFGRLPATDEENKKQ